MNFLSFFQRHGYDCFTLDLRGHGQCKADDSLHALGLEDYADDLEIAHSRIGHPSVLIGHSMGSRVVQRYLRRKHFAQGAILLSPVPASGTSASAMRLTLRYPRFFDAIEAATHGEMTDAAAALLTRIYFSPDTTPEMAQQYVAMIGPESKRALAELLLPEFFTHSLEPVPTLVMGGSDDEVFDASMLPFIGMPLNAEISRIEGAGHMLMLDPRWAGAATQMHDWMCRQAF